MMKQSDPLLPILNKVCKNKNKRLDSENLKFVISNVRIMQKRGDPTGCSNNPNAGLKDLDLALEQSKRREQDFDGIISKEMSKMNYLKPIKIEDKEIVSELIPDVKTGDQNNNTLDTIHEDKIYHKTVDGSLLPRNPEGSLLNKTLDGLLFPRNPEYQLLQKTDDGVLLSRNEESKIQNQSFEESITLSKNYTVQAKPALKAYSARIPTRRSGITQEFITRLSTPATNYFSMPPSRPEALLKIKNFERLIQECAHLNKDMKKIKNIKNVEEHESNQEKANLTEFLTGKKSRTKSHNDNNYMEEQTKLDLRISKNLSKGKKV